MSVQQPINSPVSKTKYRLEEDYPLLIKLKNRGDYIVIPKGFIWDGASISKYLAWFMRRDGLSRLASLVHDFIYGNKGDLTKYKIYKGNLYDDHLRVCKFKITRKDADKLFKSILIKSGIPSWRANIAYAGIRTFGGFYWNNN